VLELVAAVALAEPASLSLVEEVRVLVEVFRNL